MSTASDFAPREMPVKEAQLGEPWGFWATIGFSFILLILVVAIQAAVLLGMVIAIGAPVPPAGAETPPDFTDTIMAQTKSGTFIALQAIVAGILIPLCCLLFAV